jgi:membrane protein DedA with SNARE-associated domain
LDSRKLVTATFLGVIVFLVKGPLLAPYADFLLIFEAFLAGLGFALLGRGGATYVELVNGLLLTVYEASTVPVLAPFVLPLALLFGVLIDGLGTLLKVRAGGEINSRKLALDVTLASAVTGTIAYFATLSALVGLGFLPNDPNMDLALGLVVIVIGVVEGGAGGYLAGRVWERNLKARFKSVQPPLN